MSVPQPSTSKIPYAVDQLLLQAAETLTHQHDLEAVRARLVDAALEALGSDARLREIVDLLQQAVFVQHCTDIRVCMGFGSRAPPQCPAMRSGRREGGRR
jgi:hypothetical protein